MPAVMSGLAQSTGFGGGGWNCGCTMVPPSLQSPCASSRQHQNLQASLSEANPESTCRSDSSAPGTAPGTRWISVCKVPRKERNGNCTLVGIISQFINASDQQAASLRLASCWVIHSTGKPWGNIRRLGSVVPFAARTSDWAAEQLPRPPSKGPTAETVAQSASALSISQGRRGPQPGTVWRADSSFRDGRLSPWHWGRCCSVSETKPRGDQEEGTETQDGTFFPLMPPLFIPSPPPPPTPATCQAHCPLVPPAPPGFQAVAFAVLPAWKNSPPLHLQPSTLYPQAQVDLCLLREASPGSLAHLKLPRVLSVSLLQGPFWTHHFSWKLLSW